MGTGDGRLPFTLARHAPDRLFIGIDANAAGLRELSNRAFRARVPNLLYVRAAAEDLPTELAGLADRVSVVLPWGSLLAAVARPSVSVLSGVRALCQPDAKLTVVLALDADRDRSQVQRLGLATPLGDDLESRLTHGYREAGFRILSLRTSEELRRWPSTWASRLAWGRSQSVWELEARADSPIPLDGAPSANRVRSGRAGGGYG